MGLPVFPPTDFDAVIDAYLQGTTTVRMPLLVYFDFRDTPMALWGGEYDLSSGGVTWKGLGRSGLLIKVDGLDSNSNLDGSDATITVSGVDQSVTAIVQDEDRAGYVGRLAGFYAQFCDANWAPLCPPFAVRAGFMAPMTVDRTWQDSGDGTGQWVRSIKLPVWNIFAGRGNAPASYYTDRDQQLRYPGDEFFSFIKAVQDYSIIVPWH